MISELEESEQVICEERKAREVLHVKLQEERQAHSMLQHRLHSLTQHNHTLVADNQILTTDNQTLVREKQALVNNVAAAVADSLRAERAYHGAQHEAQHAAAAAQALLHDVRTVAQVEIYV